MSPVRTLSVCPLVIAALLVGISRVEAQTLTVTGQSRFIEGSTQNVAEDGTMFDFGPDRVEAPVGDFSPWIGALTVGGNISVNGAITGGWDGLNTIRIDSMSMNMGGGGGAGSSGTSSLQVHFEYQFQISANSSYTLDGLFGGSLPIIVGIQFTGPGVNIVQDSSATTVVQFMGQSGTLAPGAYTLALNGQGTVSYVGPGGNGAGGGGNQPLLTLVVTPIACRADFNDSGSVTVQDIFDFLTAYFANDPAADFNGAGGVTVQDIFDYLGAYFVGCA